MWLTSFLKRFTDLSYLSLH